MQGRPKVSVLINTCNEAPVLGPCLASVSGWADEIIVCDMESTDDSVALAQRHGAIVWSHPRMRAPEPDARVFALGKCTGEWVFILDPDMRLSPALRARLDEIVSGDLADIVDLHCLNYFFTQWCPHGHGSQPFFRKFFKKSHFHPVMSNIQTFWHDSLTGRVLALPSTLSIQHLAYPTVEAMVNTLTRYARQEAEDDFMLGRKFGLGLILWRPLKRFVGNYILRLGFLDGMPGLIASAIVSWYLFLAGIYRWELWFRSEHRTENAGPDGV
jgi:(heptosyl)LPS beta-1,4-glucosyltransferase